MRKLALSLMVVVFGLVSPAWAELKLTGDVSVPANKLVKLKATGQDPAAALIWSLPDSNGDLIDYEELPDGRLIFVAPPGTYRIKLLAIKLSADGKKTVAEAARIIVTVGPPGPGPVPPDPGPGPVPPVPPGPLPPIPVAGFRTLIVYETSELSKLPAKQAAILYAKSIRDYLQSKAVMGPDGKTKEWRMYDKDVDVSAESKIWQDAMKLPRTQVPWIVISDGKTGFSGPLPADVTSTLALLKKFGGE